MLVVVVGGGGGAAAVDNDVVRFPDRCCRWCGCTRVQQQYTVVVIIGNTRGGVRASQMIREQIDMDVCMCSVVTPAARR